MPGHHPTDRPPPRADLRPGDHDRRAGGIYGRAGAGDPGGAAGRDMPEPGPEDWRPDDRGTGRTYGSSGARAGGVYGGAAGAGRASTGRAGTDRAASGRAGAGRVPTGADSRGGRASTGPDRAGRPGSGRAAARPRRGRGGGTAEPPEPPAAAGDEGEPRRRRRTPIWATLTVTVGAVLALLSGVALAGGNFLVDRYAR